MGLFKWRGRNQAASGQPDSICHNTLEPETTASMAQAAAPEETGDEVEGQSASNSTALTGEPEISSPDDSNDDDEFSARLHLENHLLDMVSQLIRPCSDDDGQESEKSSPSELPPSADDYPAADAQVTSAWAESSSESSGFGAGSSVSREDSFIAELAPSPDDEELSLLRQLILGREIDGLETLHRHLGDPELLARVISRVVTEAIRIRVRQDSELVSVLKTTVDNIFRNSVRNNPAELADNLFPVMGPAIRRSISESIRGMLQEFNRTLEKSFSLTGLKWRLESLRTGMKFSEVVMLKTMEYQVEQVFVIHADSGTLIIHLVNENAKAEVQADVKDPEQVAAMLTAIQQFVNDSFTTGGLSTLEFGDRKIYVARAPQVYAACVVLGQAPSNIRIDLQTALELLVVECADDLDYFKNNTTPFNKARHHFNGLLISCFKDEKQKLPLKAKFFPVLLLTALLAPVGFWGYKHYQMTEIEDRVRQIANKPGLTLLEVTPRLFGRWKIICLKDDLAELPESDLAAAGLPRERYLIEYIPYVSQEHEIVLRRVRMVLAEKPPGVEDRFNPASNTLTLSGSAPIDWLVSVYERLLAVPGLAKVNISSLYDPEHGATAYMDEQDVLHLQGRASISWVLSIYERLRAITGLHMVDISKVSDPRNGVTANLDDRGVLSLQGQASVGWLDSIREQALMVPGINRVDLSEVTDDEDTVKIKKLAAAINGTVIFFQLNKDQPIPQDLEKLSEAVVKLVELEKLAGRMGLAASLIIYGHADSSGSSKRNYELSQERAKTLAALLYSKGSSIPISTFGLGSDFAVDASTEETKEQKVAADQSSRRIELRVQLDRKGPSLFQ